MFDNYDDLLDVETARKLLHISRSNLYVLLHSGQLKGYRQGHKWRIPKQCIIDYIKDRTGII